MNLSRTARLVGALVLLLTIASPVAPAAESATTLSTGWTYLAAQATPVPFQMPGAPGEAAPEGGTAATESAEPVEGGPGETGIQAERPMTTDQGTPQP